MLILTDGIEVAPTRGTKRKLAELCPLQENTSHVAGMSPPELVSSTQEATLSQDALVSSTQDATRSPLAPV